ncbi:hypothetical protein TWF706_005715 [Orbilia oligospora]|nr:hypothetical protein TWF706_005715 [Orbilia oligospora]
MGGQALIPTSTSGHSTCIRQSSSYASKTRWRPTKAHLPACTLNQMPMHFFMLLENNANVPLSMGGRDMPKVLILYGYLIDTLDDNFHDHSLGDRDFRSH